MWMAELTGSYWSLLGLSLITIGLYASNAHLFPLPSVFLTGPALATGIAWVNSVGILGGSVLDGKQHRSQIQPHPEHNTSLGGKDPAQ